MGKTLHFPNFLRSSENVIKSVYLHCNAFQGNTVFFMAAAFLGTRKEEVHFKEVAFVDKYTNAVIEGKSQLLEAQKLG